MLGAPVLVLFRGANGSERMDGQCPLEIVGRRNGRWQASIWMLQSAAKISRKTYSEARLRTCCARPIALSLKRQDEQFADQFSHLTRRRFTREAFNHACRYGRADDATDHRMPGLAVERRHEKVTGEWIARISGLRKLERRICRPPPQTSKGVVGAPLAPIEADLQTR